MYLSIELRGVLFHQDFTILGYGAMFTSIVRIVDNTAE
jgi:hypothetical protein